MTAAVRPAHLRRLVAMLASPQAEALAASDAMLLEPIESESVCVCGSPIVNIGGAWIHISFSVGTCDSARPKEG